ncbi:hypothetical protein [Phyllobacterium zundukense]|uniref:Uncharacterized protein n=1 Tax=Phyllobacterium zundukense TaxID=1867719 RepID=A0ACD4CXE5_9HYPH|nr:hypothetical protein [Phyllobacterium zundukense]UXN58239.1 hypothetical protein N8E88_05330 [Phyllobacterium zundukense]
MATPQEMEDPAARLEEVWRSRRGLVHNQMSFTRAKDLAHRIFDDAGVPRPFVKCIPANNHARGFATAKHEIFIPELPYAGALIEVCAELILGVLDPHLSENRVMGTPSYFRNCMALADRYVDRFAHADARREIYITVGKVYSTWANIKPGDSLYEAAVGDGCRMFRRNGEPEPLRDP